MTLSWLAGNVINGLSSDTKPTTNLPANYQFFETDTRKTYVYSGGSWTEQIVTGAGGTGAPDISRVIYVAQDGTGDYTTLAAAITAQGTLKEYKLNPGTHQITTQLLSSLSNVTISGAGIDVTKISIENGVGTTGAGINWTGSVGTFKNLTSNAAKGAVALVVASTTGLAAGDWIYIKRDVAVASNSATSYDAEIHQILSVDSGTQVTIDHGLYEAYNTANTATFAKITWAQTITIENLTIYDNRTTVSAETEQGDVVFNFCKDLLLENVKLQNMVFASLTLKNCFNVQLNNVIYDSPRDTSTLQYIHYGLHCGGASTNIKINGGFGYRCRHTLDFDVIAGTGTSPGRPRNIQAVNVMSYISDAAHFNTHQGAVGVTMIGCGAIGGYALVGGDSEVYGFNSRSPVTYIGCFTEGALSYGWSIGIDDNVVGTDLIPGGDRSSIIGCTIRYPQEDVAFDIGRGIKINTNRGNVKIEDCNFFGIPDEVIDMRAGVHHVQILGNTFHSCGGDLSSSGGLIRSTADVTDLVIQGNIMGAGTPAPSARPLIITTSADHLIFKDNDTNGLTNKTPTIPAISTDVCIEDNLALNPLNLLTTPINTTQNTIGLYGGTTSTIVTATDYTIVGSGVFITISGGTVSAILVKDGAGNTVVSGVTSLNGQYIPRGYKLRVTHTGAPTLTAYAV